MKKSPMFLFRSFKAFQKALVIPEGFSVTVTDVKYDEYINRKFVDVTLKNEIVGTTVRFDLSMEKIDKWAVRRNKSLKPLLGKSVVVWNGHTNYTHNGGHYSYDRCGVEDSFYNGHDFDLDPNAQILEQLARIDESRVRIDNSVTIPVIGRLISKDRLAEVRKDFKSKKSQGFSSHPSGFGMAYYITKKQTRWARRADAKIEKFFEYSPLYIQDIEMD